MRRATSATEQRLPVGPCCFPKGTSSMAEESPRYQLGPRSRRGLVAGWRGGQLAAVGAGLVAGVLLLRSVGGAAGALLAFVLVRRFRGVCHLATCRQECRAVDAGRGLRTSRVESGVLRRGRSALSTLELDEIPIGVAGRRIGVVVDSAGGHMDGDSEGRGVRICARRRSGPSSPHRGLVRRAGRVGTRRRSPSPTAVDGTLPAGWLRPRRTGRSHRSWSRHWQLPVVARTSRAAAVETRGARLLVGPRRRRGCAPTGP